MERKKRHTSSNVEWFLPRCTEGYVDLMTLFIVPHVAPHPRTTTANKQMNATFWISCTDCDHWTVFLIAIQRKNNSPHVCPLIQPQLHKNFLLDKKKNKKKKLFWMGIVSLLKKMCTIHISITWKTPLCFTENVDTDQKESSSVTCIPFSLLKI